MRTDVPLPMLALALLAGDRLAGGDYVLAAILLLVAWWEADAVATGRARGDR